MRRLSILLLTLAVACPALADADSNPPEGEYSKYHRFVFYAVLEGCYEDGLTSEEIDLIVPRDVDGNRELTVNFIYACPLCHPAFEAFRLYGSRRPFHGQKLTVYDTFGPGLETELSEHLRGPAIERRQAIQALISRWIEKRAELLRLDDDERLQLQVALKQMKTKGDELLEGYQKAGPGDHYGAKYEGWKGCPICQGAFEGAMGGIEVEGEPGARKPEP